MKEFRPHFATVAVNFLVICVLCWVVLLMTGCVSTTAIMLGPVPKDHASIPRESVRVYRSPDNVRGEYQRIALLSAKTLGRGTGMDENAVLRSLQKKAGELGANAIIVGFLGSTGVRKDEIVQQSDPLRGKALAIHMGRRHSPLPAEEFYIANRWPSRSFRLGERVRVSASPAGSKPDWVKGTVVSWRGEPLSIVWNAGENVLNRGQPATRFQVYLGTQRRPVLFGSIGTLVGAGVGLAVGGGILQNDVGSILGSNLKDEIFIGVAAGLVVGATVGWFVTTEHWEDVANR